jgi:hypothetical protein
MTTGYLTCFKGRLLDGSTLVVEGAEYPIPTRTADGSVQAGDRVRAAATEAGYRIPCAFLDAISDVDDHGGYTLELVRL